MFILLVIAILINVFGQKFKAYSRITLSEAVNSYLIRIRRKFQKVMKVVKLNDSYQKRLGIFKLLKLCFYEHD